MSISVNDLAALRYRCHRYPAEIISYAVWLYFRFPLSLRHVEELLAERGIDVSFQTVSEWASKFGREYARRIRRRSAGGFADKWHLDELVVTIKGKKHWLWRAVDADGYVLEAIVQSRRNRQAGLRLLRKLLKGQGLVPRVMVTDKLGSYAAAKRHHSRRRAQIPQGPQQSRREFLSIRATTRAKHDALQIGAPMPASSHGPIANLFHLPRNHMSAAEHRELQAAARATWREIAVSIAT